MTVPRFSFEGLRQDATHAYAAIFRPPASQPGCACRSSGGHARAVEGTGVLYVAIRRGGCWRCVPNLSQAGPEAGATVAVTMSDPVEGRRVFDALAEGGEVETPYEPTAWSSGFGCVTDRWGTHWMMDTMPPPRGGA